LQMHCHCQKNRNKKTISVSNDQTITYYNFRSIALKTDHKVIHHMSSECFVIHDKFIVNFCITGLQISFQSVSELFWSNFVIYIIQL
jgi:hypothetical protein